MNKLATRIKNVGPGALVAAAFIGPGTVTSCSISGATAGYTLLWAKLLPAPFQVLQPAIRFCGLCFCL